MTTSLPNKLCSGNPRARATTEYLGKRSGVRNGDNMIQVQLKEDGGSGSRQNWMQKSGLWPVLHLERQGINQVKTSDNYDSVSIRLRFDNGNVSSLHSPNEWLTTVLFVRCFYKRSRFTLKCNDNTTQSPSIPPLPLLDSH